ncbi:MAG: DUF362 domain-containing protein [Planctomycetota bacterium]|jgi:uncharacterized protein (DUF362 family)
MGTLDNIGLTFDESMSGFFSLGQTDPEKGAEIGERQGSALRFDVTITISDLPAFLKVSQHEAALSGTVRCDALGGPADILDGVFNLFSLDPATSMRQMVYAFKFKDDQGQTYFFHGHKKIYDDPGKIDVIEDVTRLFVVVRRGEDDAAPIHGAGVICFKLSDAPAMISSMEVIGDASLWQKAAVYSAFASFAFGAVRETYLSDMSIFYDTRYQNLVLSGVLDEGNDRRPFFLVSGVHDKGFPWGDSETFSDVLLVVADGAGGYRRYAITDRVLEGLELDVERGTYRYAGPLFALKGGYSASFQAMRSKDEELETCQGQFEIEFDAQPHEMVSFPFPMESRLVNKLARPLRRMLREALPAEYPLGINITPHAVSARSGRLTITKAGGEGSAAGSSSTLEIVPEKTHGEAERSTFRSVKEPTLLYGYICSVRPEAKAARVQIHSRVLRNERHKLVKDQLDAFLGTIIPRIASAEMSMAAGEMTVKNLGPRDLEDAYEGLFQKLGDPLLEVNNDHYPTAVFQRRIIKVRDPSGQECLALEEDMSLVRLEAIGSDRETTVASIKDEDKRAALDKALDETGFDAVVAKALKASGKAKGDFLIVIKPNFMFAYNKRDRTTFTDPELVAHLVARLRGSGFEKIAVVEAQSTYGQYFDRRSVREMADYLGFDESAGYRVVDMTEDARESRPLGPHLGIHPVSAVWRDADFRISFAKNKTHAYAYYTLTLKNIYGALPLANKFKEYHCRRDIYHTAIEYLAAFPVHFGLIDAHLSADGPFGIFADPCPNPTHTIVAGEDLVAVDWVAASKMGVNPLISPYMELAVNAFGKPAIRLVGDANVYRPWLNAPVALTLFTHKGVDASYHFGNLFYTCCAQMDETHFKHKSKSLPIRLLRKIVAPMRHTFFVRTATRPTMANRFVSWLLFKLGSA